MSTSFSRDIRLSRLERRAGDVLSMTDDELRAMAGPEDPRLTAAMALLSVDELTALASWPASGDARQAAAQHLDNILLEILYPECGDDGDSQN